MIALYRLYNEKVQIFKQEKKKTEKVSSKLGNIKETYFFTSVKDPHDFSCGSGLKLQGEMSHVKVVKFQGLKSG